MTDEHKNLRMEYIKLRNSGILQSELGCKCVNCGSSEGIQYHHIVPLSLGGTNQLINIVPLCEPCHLATHKGQHISHYVSHEGSGRPPKVPDEEVFKVLDMWADGQIGNKRCAELMGRGNYAGSVKESAQYRKWIKNRRIKNVRNILDVAITNRMPIPTTGDYIGIIEYAYGTQKEILFNDTGLNDTVIYIRRDSNEKMSWGEIKRRTKIEL